MNNELRKRLVALCEQAAVEKNSERLMQLIRDIDVVLTADKNSVNEEGFQLTSVPQAN